MLDSLYGARGDVFENMFARSWEMLSEPAQRILMVMPIFATSVTKAAIEAASDVHTWDLDEGLGQLVELSLVEASEHLEEAKRRYGVHPLTRAFAGARLGGEFEREAMLRNAEYFVEFAEKHGGYHNWEGFNKLEDEFKNVSTVLNWCYDEGMWSLVMDLSYRLVNFLRVWGYWDERITICIQALEASKQEGDLDGIRRYAYFLSRTYYYRREVDKAQRWAEEAFEVSRQLASERPASWAMRQLGNIARARGDFEEARRILLNELEIAEVEDKFLSARLKSDLGEVALDSKNYLEAEQWYEKALSAVRELPDLEMIAWTLMSLGKTHLGQENWNEAIQFFEQGLETAQEIQRRDIIARCKLGLAATWEKLGHYEVARQLGREALEILTRVGVDRDTIDDANKLVVRLERRLAGKNLDHEGTKGDNNDTRNVRQ